MQAISVSLITWRNCSLFFFRLFHTFCLFYLHWGLFAASWSLASQSHLVLLCGTVKNSCSHSTLVNRLNGDTRNRAFFCHGLNWPTTGTGGSTVPPQLPSSSIAFDFQLVTAQSCSRFRDRTLSLALAVCVCAGITDTFPQRRKI